MHHRFILSPFISDPVTSDLVTSDPLRSSPIQISGTVSRQPTTLTLHYSLSGNLADLAIAPAAAPTRQHNLWETTCFECFLSTVQSPQYWEFNVSPAGHWNVYRLLDYRQGMQIEAAFTELPFQVKTVSNLLELDLTIDLAAIALSQQPLVLGVTTVVQTLAGELSYWALQHCGTVADFHLRESWAILVPALEA